MNTAEWEMESIAKEACFKTVDLEALGEPSKLGINHFKFAQCFEDEMTYLKTGVRPFREEAEVKQSTNEPEPVSEAPEVVEAKIEHSESTHAKSHATEVIPDEKINKLVETVTEPVS